MPYVYQYLDCITLQPFYIGKGSGRRDREHLRQAKAAIAGRLKGRHSYCVNRIVSLLKKGLTPLIERIEDGLSHDDAYDLEECLIAKYGRINIDPNGILTNRDRGGRGGRDHKMSEERINALIQRNKASKGKPKPGMQEYIKANPDKHYSRRQRGVKQSESRKANISKAQKALQIGAKTFAFKSPNGEIFRPKDWRSFLIEHRLSYNLIRSKGKVYAKGPNAGWQVVDECYTNRSTIVRE